MQLNRADLAAKYQANVGGGALFKDNTTEDITALIIRTFAEDENDSIFNLIDDAYSGAKGWNHGVNTITGLKAIVTTELTLKSYIAFRDTDNSDVLRCYELVSGTTVESSPSIIRPDDYASGTNEKIWKLAIFTDSSSSFPDWDMSTNAFPTGGLRGQEYYGTELSTRTTLTDTAGNLLPSKVIAKALQDSPTTNAHFAFINVIY